MNEELNVVEVVETETTNECPIEVTTFDNSMSNNTKIALGVGLAVLTGGIGLVIANRHKIKNWVNEKRIKKLEKDGYAVSYTIVPLENKDSEVVVKNEETK